MPGTGRTLLAQAIFSRGIRNRPRGGGQEFRLTAPPHPPNATSRSRRRHLNTDGGITQPMPTSATAGDGGPQPGLRRGPGQADVGMAPKNKRQFSVFPSTLPFSCIRPDQEQSNGALATAFFPRFLACSETPSPVRLAVDDRTSPIRNSGFAILHSRSLPCAALEFIGCHLRPRLKPQYT